MIGLFLILVAMFLVLYSIFHLVVHIVSGETAVRDMFWFWIILGLPVIGSIIYFSYQNFGEKWNFNSKKI